jgi:hypothetical protein
MDEVGEENSKKPLGRALDNPGINRGLPRVASSRRGRETTSEEAIDPLGCQQAAPTTPPIGSYWTPVPTGGCTSSQGATYRSS